MQQLRKELTRDLVLTKGFDPIAWLVKEGFDLDRPIDIKWDTAQGTATYVQDLPVKRSCKLEPMSAWSADGLGMIGERCGADTLNLRDQDSIRKHYGFETFDSDLRAAMLKHFVGTGIYTPEEAGEILGAALAESKEEESFSADDIAELIGYHVRTVVKADDSLFCFAVGNTEREAEERSDLLVELLNEDGYLKKELDEMRRKRALELAIKVAGGATVRAGNAEHAAMIVATAALFEGFLRDGLAASVLAAADNTSPWRKAA